MVATTYAPYTASLRLLCRAGCCCGSQTSQLRKAVGCSLRWKLAWYLLAPWKLVLREEASRQIQLSPLSLKRTVFSAIRAYLPPLQSNAGQRAVAGGVLGVSQTILADNSKEGLIPNVGFLLAIPWLT